MELAPTVPSSRKRSWTSHIHQNHIKSPWRQQGYWESADAEWLLSCWWGVSQVARRRLHPSLSWFYLYLPHFSFFKYFKLFYSYAAAAAAKSLQSCPTLCDPIDGSPPGPLVPGILQARTLGWVAISFSNAWKWKVKVKSLRRVWLFATPWTAAHEAPPPMGFSRQEYWSGVPSPFSSVQFTSVQSLSCVRLFAAPWIAACQASLSITNSRSSLKLTSIESVMPSSHLILLSPSSCP